MTYFDPTHDEKQATVVREWFNEVSRDKGSRAELRRSSDLLSILLNSVVHQLASELKRLDIGVDITRIAFVAAILSEIDYDLSEPLGQTLARVFGKNGNKSDGGERNFKRLVLAEKEEFEKSLLTWRRIVRLCDRRLSLVDLAGTTYWLNDRAKKQLAISFYENFNG